jgi:hypothetical protein
MIEQPSWWAGRDSGSIRPTIRRAAGPHAGWCPLKSPCRHLEHMCASVGTRLTYERRTHHPELRQALGREPVDVAARRPFTVAAESGRAGDRRPPARVRPTALRQGAMMDDTADGHALIKLTLAIVAEPGADLGEIDRLGRQLSAELAEFDVDTVATSPPDGLPLNAKGTDPLAISELIITLGASGGVLATVVAGVRDWLQRRAEAHRITLTIDGDTLELARASAAERAALLNAFVARHSR